VSFAAVVLIFAGAISLNRQQHLSPGGSAADIGANGPIGGQYTTLDGAASKVPFEIVRPQDTLASDASIESVWVSSPGDQPGVQLRYASGITVSLLQWPKGKNPATSYKSQWAESGNLGSLETINGHPAWIVPGDVGSSVTQLPDGTTEGSGVMDPSMNTVELTVDQVDVLIQGKQSIDDLVGVAQTVK
jgi:hypothetical protein